jgi:hypothetical protein
LTKVKDPAIMSVMRCMLKLTSLTISLCEKLTRDSLAAINDWGEGMTSLEMLVPQPSPPPFFFSSATHGHVGGK